MGIEYEEDQFENQIKSTGKKSIRGITGFMLRKGIVRKKSEATMIFIIVIIIALIISIVIYQKAEEKRLSRTEFSIDKHIPQSLQKKIHVKILNNYR